MQNTGLAIDGKVPGSGVEQTVECNIGGQRLKHLWLWLECMDIAPVARGPCQTDCMRAHLSTHFDHTMTVGNQALQNIALGSTLLTQGLERSTDVDVVAVMKHQLVPRMPQHVGADFINRGLPV
tara:strand:+ start:5629 stop:6000 length:372 start_codon:yes stop_codon:yes gene_type:complete